MFTEILIQPRNHGGGYRNKYKIHQIFQEASIEEGKNLKNVPEAFGSKANVRVSVVSQESESKDDDSEVLIMILGKMVTRKKLKKKPERKEILQHLIMEV